MVPANIISGFKTCGIYPFNPKEVLDHDPKPKESDRVPITDNHEILDNTDKASVATTFTAEEETLFARWYENGYNIHNPRYVYWIELNHPEDGLVDLFPDVTPLEPLNMDSDLPEERLSATFNTLPSESSELLPQTGSVSPCLSITEGNSTRSSSTENGHISVYFSKYKW